MTTEPKMDVNVSDTSETAPVMEEGQVASKTVHEIELQIQELQESVVSLAHSADASAPSKVSSKNIVVDSNPSLSKLQAAGTYKIASVRIRAQHCVRVLCVAGSHVNLPYYQYYNCVY